MPTHPDRLRDIDDTAKALRLTATEYEWYSEQVLECDRRERALAEAEEEYGSYDFRTISAHADWKAQAALVDSFDAEAQKRVEIADATAVLRKYGVSVISQRPEPVVVAEADGARLQAA